MHNDIEAETVRVLRVLKVVPKPRKAQKCTTQYQTGNIYYLNVETLTHEELRDTGPKAGIHTNTPESAYHVTLSVCVLGLTGRKFSTLCINNITTDFYSPSLLIVICFYFYFILNATARWY